MLKTFSFEEFFFISFHILCHHLYTRHTAFMLVKNELNDTELSISARPAGFYEMSLTLGDILGTISMMDP